MGDWNVIASWDASGVRAVGDDLAAELATLRGTEAELREAATPKEWDGEGAEAAKRSLSGIERGVLHRVEEFAMLRAAADDAAARLEQLQLTMADLHDVATANGLRIVDGALAALPDGPEPDPDARAGIEAHIEQVIRTGLDIDADLTTVLRSIVDGQGLSDSSTMAAAADAGTAAGNSTMVEPPRNATPEQNKAWWDTLSPEERRSLIATDPASIGNRKGIPYEARHEANLNRIDDERERLRAELESMQGAGGVIDGILDDGPIDFFRNREQIEAKLDALDVLTEQADRGNLIMSLDTDGERVRAAVGIGDVDNADYLSVHTPGMNSAVERNMNRYVDEMTETTEYAQRMLEGTGKTAATVVWMDYLPPQGTVFEGLQALSDDLAEAGGERLAAELEGIQASRYDDPPERLTATGHSYGSLTTGIALRQTDAVDAFVSTGSPGWGDGGGDGLQVPRDEQYNMRNDGDDLVAGTGWHGGNPENYDGVRQLDTHDAVSADGSHLEGSEGHSGYMSADQQQSTTEYNTAAVIVGREDLLIDAPLAGAR